MLDAAIGTTKMIIGDLERPAEEQGLSVRHTATRKRPATCAQSASEHLRLLGASRNMRHQSRSLDPSDRVFPRRALQDHAVAAPSPEHRLAVLTKIVTHCRNDDVRIPRGDSLSSDRYC